LKTLSHLPIKNGLLASLPLLDLDRWLPQLELVDMTLGQVVYEPGESLTHVYFPLTAVVSMLYVTQSGDSGEIAIGGKEGVVGGSLFIGDGRAQTRAVVQCAGTGLRLKASMVREEFDQRPQVKHILLRYIQALLAQMSQTAACNRHHSLDQQLCRWMLLILDRLDSCELRMTQELIANMLGVRRGTVTEAAVKLQDAGLIRYARGHITVLDRKRLEQRSCECYAVVTKEYGRLLGGQ
jgi:CRP-like cAMP-binding protein